MLLANDHTLQKIHYVCVSRRANFHAFRILCVLSNVWEYLRVIQNFFRNDEDERLKWLKNVFIPYLENWHYENVQRFGSSSKRSFLTQ